MGLGAAIRVNGVPDTDFDGAALVEVVERAGETTTYMLRLPVTPRDGDLSWLSDDRIAPGADLGVYVATDDGEVCLVRGPVTGQQIRIVHGGAGSQIEVSGADAAAALDRAFRTRVWEGARDSDAVSAIAGEAGFVADVQTTDAVHRSGVRALAQCDTDLRFLRRLARLNGYLAWLSTDAASGTHTLHFKPPPLDGPASLTLTINQDGATTDAIDVRVDGERPTSVDARQIDPLSAEDIDASGTASSLAALGSQPIGSVLSGTRSTRLVAPGDDAAEVNARARGVAADSSWFVQASLETTLAGTGKAVRAHTVVELTGAGGRHSGTWFCAGVQHLIDATGHRMVVELVRNAWSA